MNSFPSSSPAEVWANLRRLYPIYTALFHEFSIENDPCLVLEAETQTPTAETIAEAERWFSEMDQKIQIQHLRQFAQTSQQVNEAVLRDLLFQNFDKKQRSQRDRDKVDFLLVQIFSEHAPENSEETAVNLKAVGKVLEPVLGTVEFKPAGFLKELDDLLEESRQHKTLKSLFTARLIERSRQIKDSCGDAFYEPLTLAAFARFGFLMRRTLFRLMHQDLNVILDGLRELELRGVTALDGRKAQFSAEESITRLRMICQSWKVMFQAEYSAGQPLCILVDLRTAVEQALKQSPVKTAAAVASGTADREEFEARAAASESADLAVSGESTRQ
jgi:hypothetical protein